MACTVLRHTDDPKAAVDLIWLFHPVSVCVFWAELEVKLKIKEDERELYTRRSTAGWSTPRAVA